MKIIQKTKNRIKWFGLLYAFAFMLVVMATWVYAELNGYTHFRAGEPVRLTLYTEWALTILSMIVVLNELRIVGRYI